MRKHRPHWTAAVAATVLAAAAALAGIGTAHAESNGGVRVMPLGDSITDGLTVPGGYRIDLWQKMVAGGYRVDFVGSLFNGPSSLGDHDHEGHSGWTIAQIDANIVRWLQTSNPHSVLLHIGTNDMFSASAGAPQRLSTLIDHITATAPDAEVFVSTIIPLNGADSQVRTYNAAIPAIVQSKGPHVHLVDMFPALTLADLADGVHPNAGGYSKMATVWFNALRSVPGSIGNPGGTSPSQTATSPTTSPPPGTSACTAAYTMTGQWSGGFQASVRVTAGNRAINGWTVTGRFANGQTVTQAWNATVTTSGSSFTARNVSYNGALGAGASTEFGFLGTWTGTNQAPTLTCAAS
jgi:lysophospholipase L1-like esterase